MLGRAFRSSLTTRRSRAFVEPLESRWLLAADLDIADTVDPADDNAVQLADTILGMTSAVETFSLTAVGADPVNITTFALGGVDPGEFDIVVKDDTGTVVAPADFTIPAGKTYTIEVTFSPTAIGGASAQIAFNSDDLALPFVTLDLSGTGLPVPPPEIDITDSVAPNNDLFVSFPDTTEGQISPTRKFTLTNTGMEGLDITNFAVGGAHPGDFQVTVRDSLGALVATSNFTIGGGESYEVRVQFAPTIEGIKSAQITFGTNDTDESSITLTMSGTAIAIDPGSTAGTALNIGKLVGRRLFDDAIGTAGDGIDVYRFQMVEKGTVRLELSGLSGDVHLKLIRLYSSGTERLMAASLNPGNADELIFESVPAATYLAKVTRRDKSVTTVYDLAMEADYALNRIGTPRKINVFQGLLATKVFNDSIGPKDPYDYYTFTTAGPHTIVLTLSGLTQNADIQLLDSAGKVLRSSRSPGTASELIQYNELGGKYFIRVIAKGDNTNYTMSLNTVYPPL